MNTNYWLRRIEQDQANERRAQLTLEHIQKIGRRDDILWYAALITAPFVCAGILIWKNGLENFPGNLPILGLFTAIIGAIWYADWRADKS